MRKQVFALSKQDETKLRVFRSVDKPVDKLTVADICKKAGISRQLFYRYFNSKFDPPIWYTVKCDVVTMAEIGRTLSWEEGLLGFYDLLRDEKEVLVLYVNSKEDLASRHWADERRARIFKETISDFRHLDLTPEMEFYANSYANTFNKVFATWLQKGLKEEPAYMAKLTLGLVPQELYNALELSAK
jgi:AcrR family transcriptional regulator